MRAVRIIARARWGGRLRRQRVSRPASCIGPWHLIHCGVITPRRVFGLRTLLPAFALLLAAAMTLPASTVVLSPGEIYQLTFTTNPIAYPCPIGPCDTLFISPDYVGAPVGVTIQAQLYDGSTLLGTDLPGVCCAMAFVASGSLFNDLNAPVVDFTSIQNGTIQGIIDISVTGAALYDFSVSGTGLALGHATGTGTLSIDSQSLTLTSAGLLTPEPDSASLAALGFGALALGVAIRRTVYRRNPASR